MRTRAITRREALKVVAAGAAGLSGCLGAAVRDLPAGPATWPTFRFAHVGDLRLSIRDPAGRAWALAAAEAVRSLPGLDFLLLTGDPVAAGDRFGFLYFEEFLRAAGLPCYASSGAAAFPGEPEARHLEAESLAAWRAPWAASPAPGVRLAGLCPGPSSPDSGGEPDPSALALSAEADAHPSACVIAVLPSPVRVPEPLEKLRVPPPMAEDFRFVLEAASPVKMAVCGGAPLPTASTQADLVVLGASPPAEYPRAIREVTVMGHGAVVRTIFLEPSGKPGTPPPDLAKRFDPADPGALEKWVAGEAGEKVLGLR
ncbi:MAG: hypothetical protein MUC63_03535 [Planctomycetes bacterium]|jgi:hypothetical protein|nr:hypothetical protein [Planctomycetota bacterium]